MHWHHWQLYPFFDRMSFTIPGQIHSFPLLSLPLLSSLLPESKGKGFHWQVRASYLNSSLAVTAAAQGSSCSNLRSSQLFLNTPYYTQSHSWVILPPASLLCILPSSHIKFIFLPWLLSLPLALQTSGSLCSACPEFHGIPASSLSSLPTWAGKAVRGTSALLCIRFSEFTSNINSAKHMVL